MPKMRTSSGAKKRFKLTASGKVKRKKAYKSHLLSSKTKKQKRNLRNSGIVHKTEEKNIKRLLCI